MAPGCTGAPDGGKPVRSAADLSLADDGTRSRAAERAAGVWEGKRNLCVLSPPPGKHVGCSEASLLQDRSRLSSSLHHSHTDALLHLLSELKSL